MMPTSSVNFVSVYWPMVSLSSDFASVAQTVYVALWRMLLLFTVEDVAKRHKKKT